MCYAFLIDHNTCIGCHACTVACKSEHDVPLEVNRTWVKFIESGEFPDTRRILTDFIANGGRVRACGACTGPRGITADDFVEGATIVTAANLVEAVTDGADQRHAPTRLPLIHALHQFLPPYGQGGSEFVEVRPLDLLCE